jgi:hypothetical protein
MTTAESMLRRNLMLKSLCFGLMPWSLAKGTQAQGVGRAAKEEAWPTGQSMKWFQEQQIAYRLRGQANMRWFGLLLYEARLWTPESFDSRLWADHSFALELIYARAFEGAKIAQTSLELMQAQHGKSAERDRQWLLWMQQSFPNIQEKDRLLGLHRGSQGGCRFVHNNQTRGDIADPAFSRAFFGIWLDSRTTEPALRRSLFGES